MKYYFQNRQESPNKWEWSLSWAFLTFKYGFNVQTRKIVVARAMSLLDGEWDNKMFKKRLDQSFTEVNYLRLLVVALATGDRKHLTGDEY